jgi:3-oxoacyl-(acyl-carrier-protein) synthase
MSLRIAGMGWITPLGRGIESVWEQLLRGECASTEMISEAFSVKEYHAFRVPSAALKDLPPHPRLRRASAISRFAAAAGLDALEHAKSAIGKIDIERAALIFAASNGGVVYTKRFYHDIVASGAQSASPLFFPETVFNAPASHLAAILGISGASYTVVGDGAVGMLAMKMAENLLENEAADICLIVGAEEADWVLCDAYHKWRLHKSEPPVELFRDPPRGTILSEGAGAVLIAREGLVEIETIDAGGNFSDRSEADELVRQILSRLATKNACVIGSANGTFVDLAERAAIERETPEAIFYSPKIALGESVGASAMWQIIAAAEALRRKRLPGAPGAPGVGISCKKAIVLSCGVNQQAAGLRLSI